MLNAWRMYLIFIFFIFIFTPFILHIHKQAKKHKIFHSEKIFLCKQLNEWNGKKEKLSKENRESTLFMVYNFYVWKLPFQERTLLFSTPSIHLPDIIQFYSKKLKLFECYRMRILIPHNENLSFFKEKKVVKAP